MNIRLLTFLFLLVIFSCKEKYTPKPYAYFRIDFPKKQYHALPNKFPYQFQIPDYSKITKDPSNPDKNNWINIEVPANKAEIHLSYYNLENGIKSSNFFLAQLVEESRSLAYKHSEKANAIGEQLFINPEKNVFGTVYKIKGNTASSMQFFLTDSTKHFLRGALYISATPNIDSLKPVIEFLETDVVKLIETTSWN